MKVERIVRSGQISRQRGDALQRLLLRGRAAHAPEHVGLRVLERDVEIGQHLALGHQRDDLVDVRVGIDVVQPHPDAELAERARPDRETLRGTSRPFQSLAAYLRSTP